ncbi:OmpH family outer membrane protein [Porphyromonas cangingivalis]|uniref:Membrane protein n=1 Tax=Porphyromonas cangingivalis TaxID=36874 RepID=A0A0A2ETP9_PORCN|nr:OmpH family outer membrane protein [Porphyromonas cangingivalis]KGN79719.1 membrane protein [Porphyromonas cangingivalis]SJZ30801.1 periplasmic chaperone for outer membrane proteins Skp [Porphyromonas cangingivalis]SPY35725.1 Outer membrane protein [Porphyromonas cangingivalis]VEJ04303.1 Outer membrane protein [Porphyromonas cangingivalis]
MKNLNTIINVVLAVAVLVLFILFFSNKGENKGHANISSSTDSVVTLPVAYVNVDSLLSGYEFSRDLNEQVLRKSESAQATLNQQARALEAEAAEFQRKLQNNAFFDRERAEKEQMRILKKREDFERLNQKLTLELQEKQLEMNRILRDTIMSQVKLFNEIHKYQIIYSNTLSDNILLADEKYDITAELIEFLNKRYVPTEETSAQ